MDVLVLGAGPAALAIAAALGKEGLKVSALTAGNPREPWPYTYGIWGEEVDAFDMGHLLEHRWANTVSFLAQAPLTPGLTLIGPVFIIATTAFSTRSSSRSIGCSNAKQLV